MTAAIPVAEPAERRRREPDRAPQLDPARDSILALQRSAGNAAVARAIAEGETGTAPAPSGPADEYRVEIKGWIPHSRVPDPELPLRMAANNVVRSVTYSEFYGDGHAGYAGGTHRARSHATFRWDGSAIAGWTQAGDTSGTTRYESYVGLGGSGTSTTRGSAPGTWTGAPVGSTGFQLSYSAADPLSIMPAPNMDGQVTGNFSGGNLNLTVNTDAFPSHGIQVKRNGSVVSEIVTNDASGQYLGDPLTAGPILLTLLNVSATPVAAAIPDPRAAPGP